MAKPLIKWAGGKRQLLGDLMSLFPSQVNTYYEPFFGGGALFFGLKNEGMISKAVISDRNAELHNLYSVLKEKPVELLEVLKGLKYGNSSRDFYSARSRFNSMLPADDPVQKAAILIFLNHHCYNGLFRVNSKGEFNVPFGKYSNPGMPGPGHIMEVSAALGATSIRHCDFEEALEEASNGDFAYLDPPYAPLTRTSSFTTYAPSGFDMDDQRRLARTAKKLDSRGVSFMLSNSDTEDITALYEGFNIRRVKASRAINSNPSQRGGISEIIVTNF